MKYQGVNGVNAVVVTKRGSDSYTNEGTYEMSLQIVLFCPEQGRIYQQLQPEKGGGSYFG